jgi:hypothetical protein
MGRRREGSRKAFKIVAGQEVLSVLSVFCGNVLETTCNHERRKS